MKLLLLRQWSSIGRRFSWSLTVAAPTASATSTTSAPPTTASTAAAIGFLARLVLRLRRVIDEQRVERERVRQDDVANRAAADIDRVELDLLTVLLRQLDRLHRDIHDWRDAGDGAVDEGAVLELNGHRLVLALHQEARIGVS